MEIIKETFTSVKDNVTQKVSNPLLATILFIWIFKNWRLVFALFNFDEKATLRTKLLYIEKYFDKKDFYGNLGDCIWYAFVVLTITYVLLSASRFIVNIFDRIVIPFVYKITDKGSIVLKSDYELLSKNKDTIESRYLTEKEAKGKLQNDVELLEKKVGELTLEKAKREQLEILNAELQKSADRIPELETNLEFAKAELDKLKQLNNQLSINNDELSSEIAQKSALQKDLDYYRFQFENLKNEVELNYSKIILTENEKKGARNFPDNNPELSIPVININSHKLTDRFLEISRLLINNRQVDINESDKIFFINNVIEYYSKGEGSEKLLRLTNLGRKVYKYFVTSTLDR